MGSQGLGRPVQAVIRVRVGCDGAGWGGALSKVGSGTDPAEGGGG